MNVDVLLEGPISFFVGLVVIGVSVPLLNRKVMQAAATNATTACCSPRNIANGGLIEAGAQAPSS